MIGQVGIKAAEYIQRIVIGDVVGAVHRQAAQLAAQDAQVVGHVVADDDGAVGKAEKVGEGFLRIAAFAAEQLVADMMDIV